MELPEWFLVLSLFLPRISLIVSYVMGDLPDLVPSSWISITLAVLIPRGLMLILIFEDRGMSPWLLLHGLAMGIAYAGAGSKSKSKSK